MGNKWYNKCVSVAEYKNGRVRGKREGRGGCNGKGEGTYRR